jgi:tetratricopeptide (TPR) repeat protein
MPTASAVPHDPALDAHLFWFRYRREILVGISVIVLALLAYGAYWLYTDRREASAAALLATAHETTAYQQVISRFDNTNAGATAYVLLADAQRKDGKYVDSNVTLQKFLDKHPKHELAPSARMAMAANLQSLGKTDEALSAYQRVAGDFPKSFEAPLALISQVGIFKSKGQTDAARRACETILTQYRDSIWANEAQQQLRLLKPPTPPGAAPGIPGGPNLGGQKGGPPPLLARPPTAPAETGAPSAAPAPSGAAPAAKASPKKP